VTAEQVLHAQAQHLRRKGLSLRAVARELEAKGFRTRKGRPFAPVQVQRMLA